MNSQRPLSISIAAILLALLSAQNVVVPLMPGAVEGIPAFVIYLAVALGVVGLVAAYGLWRLKQWSVWLVIPVSVLNILSAWPGVGGAPTTLLFVAAIVTVVGFALIVVLVLLPSSRRTYV